MAAMTRFRHMIRLIACRRAVYTMRLHAHMFAMALLI